MSNRCESAVVRPSDLGRETLRRVVLALGALALTACGPCSGDVGDAHAGTPSEGSGQALVAEGSADEGSGEGAGEGSGDAEGSAEPEFVALWIGLYCNETDVRLREFSFYLDGRQVQQLETRCTGEATPPEDRPNGGQFRVPVRRGVQMLRIQDDTHDYFSEYEIAIPGDHWVFVDHKVLPGNTGHLTSTLNWFVPPSFAY